ncbi:MAG: hypothetical protein M3220_15040 [Chloroflexota bacterium]|nr:hypothetical protein [Chloroflexota bacterium]
MKAEHLWSKSSVIPFSRKESVPNGFAVALKGLLLDARLATCMFLLSGVWALATAGYLNQGYQDSWVLDGIVVPFSLFILSYFVALYQTERLERVAILTALFAFLLNAVPALKYVTPYLSTVDTATHISMIRTIAATGQVEQATAYTNTPAFHALVALLAGCSGLSLEFWSRVIPAFLGSTIPLGFYMLGTRMALPAELSKITIILSALCLPNLHTLNGTNLASPLFVSVVAILFLPKIDRSGGVSRIACTLLLLLLIAQMIVWHPGTSLLMPFTFLMLGLVEWLAPKDLFLPHSRAFVQTSILALIGAVAYWIFDARFIFHALVENISIALQADTSPNLIPTRLSQLSLADRALIGLLYHARDGIVLSLALPGLFLLFKERRDRCPSRALRTFGLAWLAFALLLLLIFGIDFGSQGYRRFLIYMVVLSPLLGAYSLWRMTQLVHVKVGWVHGRGSVVVLLAALFAVGMVQLYPYQPIVPSFSGGDAPADRTPAVWLHQVNSMYQYYMLRFAHRRLPSDTQIVADYVGYQQSRLFFGFEARSRLRQTTNQESVPTFLTLHRPGKAGGYVEKAEYRSARTIEQWRTDPRTSLVYDNGESFILYYPENDRTPFSLER